jgi:hypothetical protein
VDSTLSTNDDDGSFHSDEGPWTDIDQTIMEVLTGARSTVLDNYDCEILFHDVLVGMCQCNTHSRLSLSLSLARQ